MIKKEELLEVVLAACRETINGQVAVDTAIAADSLTLVELAMVLEPKLKELGFNNVNNLLEDINLKDAKTPNDLTEKLHEFLVGSSGEKSKDSSAGGA